MAEKFKDYDRLLNMYESNAGWGYCDPTVAALEVFLPWVAGEGVPGDDRRETGPGIPSSYDETRFYSNGHVPICLYDLAYVWLAEADAVRYCPTFDLWMMFLVAYADATRYFADPSASGAELSLMRDVDMFHDGKCEDGIRNLDVLYRDPDRRRGYGDDADIITPEAGIYRHPALRREVYDLCSADYQRRIRQN